MSCQPHVNLLIRIPLTHVWTRISRVCFWIRSRQVRWNLNQHPSRWEKSFSPEKDCQELVYAAEVVWYWMFWAFGHLTSINVRSPISAREMERMLNGLILKGPRVTKRECRLDAGELLNGHFGPLNWMHLLAELQVNVSSRPTSVSANVSRSTFVMWLHEWRWSHFITLSPKTVVKRQSTHYDYWTNRLAQQSICLDVILTFGPTVGPMVIETGRVQFW